MAAPGDPELRALGEQIAKELMTEPYKAVDRHISPSDVDYVRGVIRRALSKLGGKLVSYYAGPKRQRNMFRRLDRPVHYRFHLKQG